MHHYHDIQPVGWMRLETTNEYIPLQCRQGLVIYFDVSNGKPAFLNSFRVRMNPTLLRICELKFLVRFQRSQRKAV
jgi:hypothetical protein